MRLNGLYVVAELAVRRVADPLVMRHRRALVLGAIREDVAWLPLPLPGRGVVYEHLSLSHFARERLPGGFVPFVTDGAPRRAGKLFARALGEARAGRDASAFVQLGRVVHLVADMACPVHAHAVAHVDDRYEWWVEAHKDELLALDVPEVPDDVHASASDLAERMARFTRSLGAWRDVSAREAGDQARVLIPAAAAHAAAVLRLFLRELRERRERRTSPPG